MPINIINFKLIIKMNKFPIFFNQILMKKLIQLTKVFIKIKNKNKTNMLILKIIYKTF